MEDDFSIFSEGVHTYMSFTHFVKSTRKSNKINGIKETNKN